jgi:hypothetical protein
MKESQKVIAIFISISLAVLTLGLMEMGGISDKCSDYFFGNMKNMGQLNYFLQKSYFEGIKTIMLLVFMLFVLYMAFFVMIFLCFSFLYFLLKSKWRKPSVFISHKHSGEGALVNTSQIALDIKAVLEKQGFRICFFKYTNELHHDEVNHQIRDLLRQSDCMVVVPDPYAPSYVNTEIQCAAYDHKPVYIIKHTLDQKLPDTANSGHPVILYQNLDKTTLSPLPKIMNFVHNYWTHQINILLYALLAPFFVLVEEDEDGFSLKQISFFAAFCFLMVFFNVPLVYVLSLLKLLIIGIGAYACYMALNDIFKKSNLQKAVNQSIVTGGTTYDYFKEADLGDEVLNVLDKNGLALKH